MFTADEYREPQLAEGLTSMTSLITLVDLLPSRRLIISDPNVAAYVCDYLLEESTHQLIAPLVLCSFMHLCHPDYSS